MPHELLNALYALVVSLKTAASEGDFRSFSEVLEYDLEDIMHDLADHIEAAKSADSF